MTPHALFSTVIALPLLLACALAAAAFPRFIKLLKDKQVEQYIREEGPQSHAKKAKTPTAGGVCFIVAFVIVSVGWLSITGITSFETVPVIATGLVCALIGFIDDFAKIRNKRNDGISAKVRLVSELTLGLALAGALAWIAPDSMRVYLSNRPNYEFFALPLPVFVLLSAFLVPATSNSLNLHDGMDGLCAGTSIMVFLTLAVMLLTLHAPALAAVAATACGALLGFLIYNKNPAKIFMGDTGSLFIGGLISALVLASGTVLYFIPLALIYIAEAVSVMVQVSYFKLTKPYTPPNPMSGPALGFYKLTHSLPGEGKRVFRMAPLHHHYEAVLAEKGVKEVQVVQRFWLVQLAICSVVLAVFFWLR